MSAAPSARFPATAWSCIEAASDQQHPKYVTALNRLVTAYWRPVFHFLRAKYPAAPDPEAITQGFFLTLVSRGWLARVDAARGRFRDFLKTLLKRFAFDQTVRAPCAGHLPRGNVFSTPITPVHRKSAVSSSVSGQMRQPPAVSGCHRQAQLGPPGRVANWHAGPPGRPSNSGKSSICGLESSVPPPPNKWHAGTLLSAAPRASVALVGALSASNGQVGNFRLHGEGRPLGL